MSARLSRTHTSTEIKREYARVDEVPNIAYSVRQVHPRNHARPIREPDLHARRRLRLVHLEPRPERLRSPSAPTRTRAPTCARPTAAGERAGDRSGLGSGGAGGEGGDGGGG